MNRAALLSRIERHARQLSDCCALARRCEQMQQPLNRAETAIVRQTVRTHARLAVSWVNKLR